LLDGSQFFAHHPPQNHLNWFLLTRNVFTQGVIDKRLVMPTPAAQTPSRQKTPLSTATLAPGAHLPRVQVPGSAGERPRRGFGEGLGVRRRADDRRECRSVKALTTHPRALTTSALFI